jgi:hypothetical protein
MIDTIGYSPKAQGWTTRYSFTPEHMVWLNNNFYTFKGGNIFRHHTSPTINSFYGEVFPSKIQFVANDAPIQSKLLKAVTINGTAPWDVEAASDIRSTGFIESTWFEKEEGEFSTYLRTRGNDGISENEPELRSIRGIGKSLLISTGPTAAEINFSTSVTIGSGISIGDRLYFLLPPYVNPVFFGIITDVDIDLSVSVNQITVDTTAGSVPPIQDPMIAYAKNSVVESYGLLGHYYDVTLTTDSTERVELFSVGAEVMKSFV